MRLPSLFAVLLLSSAALPQSVTSLRGRVTDSSHAVVPGAHVTLTSSSNGSVREMETDGGGGYEFSQLQPGPYSLRITASGFQAAEASSLQLLVGTPATMDFSLSVASQQQRVEVTGEEPVVNTVDATLGNAFDQRQVSALPLEGRNVVELLSRQ